jgi:hypothetical protein
LSALPAGAKPGDLIAAFWDPATNTWVTMHTTVTAKADGSVNVTTETNHFTLFAVLVTGRPATGAPPKPANTNVRVVDLAPGWTIVVWSGTEGASPADEAKAIKGAANAVIALWRVGPNGDFQGYIVGAPDFAQAGLDKLHRGEPLIVGMRSAGTWSLPALN